MTVVGVIAGGVGWLVHQHNQQQMHQRLDQLAERAVARLEARVRTYEYGLRGARGAVAAVGLDQIDRRRFQAYIATRDLPLEFPGAHGFGFIRRVSPTQQDAYVQQLRRTSRPDFDIRQLTPHDGDRFVIEQVEPEVSNRAAIGLDIGSEPLRRRAAELAEQRGRAVLTGPITLVQRESQNAGGLLMLLPVYAPDDMTMHAAGWVYAPLLLDEVMAGYDFERGAFGLAIDDVGEGSAPQRSFQSAGFDALPAGLPVAERGLDLYGRRWSVTLRATPAFVDGLRESSPWQAAVAVFLLGSALLGCGAYYRRSSRRLRQAHEDHAHLAAIVENSIDAIIGKRGDGTVTSWNRAAEQMFGYTREQAVGRPLATLIIPPELLDEETHILGRIATGERVSHFDTVRRTRDGRLLNVSIAVSPIRDEQGHIVGASKTVRDITLQKEAEQRIRQLNITLEQQVAERTRELYHALEAAQQAAQAKSAFLANMSHEIRTPMNAVLGLAYLVERETHEPEVRSMVAKIGESGRLLLRILNDVLDFSKIEQGRLELESSVFDLQGVLDRLATMMAASVGDKPVELVVGPLPPGVRWVLGDSTRLEQVLANLAGNAVKFTAEGHVRVEVQVAQRHDDELLLRCAVCDSGIGIPADKLDAVFEPFTQVDASTTRRYGGSGLGLAICRQLVALMGGQMGVESLEGRGSEFWFTVRLRAATETAQPQDRLRHLSVLFADDSEIARESLRHTGEQLGWQCRAVADGESALQVALTGAQEPDVLVLDWQMPGLDGLSVAREFKQRTAPSRPPPVVVMVTARSREELSAHPDAVFADSVLAKPVTASRLYDAVALALHRRGDMAEPLPPVADTQRRLDGMRLLVVDDSDINRELARRILEREGAVIEEAADGQQALQMLQAQPQRAQVVLMDVQMPVMDGLTATGMIRQIPDCVALPVVALTAGAFASDREAALAAGVNAVVTKPFDVDHLVAVIHDLMADRINLADEDTLAAAVVPSADDGLIDVAAGQRTWGDPTIYLRYLDRFFAEYGGFAQELRTLPRLTVGRAVHRFKGAAAAVCLPALVAAAQALEEVERTDDPIAAAIDRLERDLQATLAAWQRRRRVLALPRVFALLRQLVRALEVGTESDALVTELASWLAEPEITELRTALQRGQRRAAVDEVRAIGQRLRDGSGGG